VLTLFSVDVATQYAFGHNNDRLSVPDFDAKYCDDMNNGVKNVTIFRHNLWILGVVSSLPLWLVAKIFPEFANWMSEQKV